MELRPKMKRVQLVFRATTTPMLQFILHLFYRPNFPNHIAHMYLHTKSEENNPCHDTFMEEWKVNNDVTIKQTHILYCRLKHKTNCKSMQVFNKFYKS